jgi:eukaryotic-like serine/threonine-protein kinase
VFDVVDQDGRPWIVMELIPSRSLAQALHERGPLPERDVAELGLHLLDALTAAHSAGILHRDVKPSNVLLGEGGWVVLTDFGIATLEGDATLTQSGVLLGSPAYVAPELARGGRAGPESDLWSLGATLYTAVEGRPPHDRGAPLLTLAAVANEDPEPPIRAGRLAPVLEGLLRKDPSERMGAEEAEHLLLGVVTAPNHPRPAEPTAPPALPSPDTPSPDTPATATGAPTGQPPPGARTGSWRGFRPLIALIALLIVTAAAFLVQGLLRPADDKEASRQEPPASPSAQTTGTPTQPPTSAPSVPTTAPTPTGAPRTTAPAIPAGFHRYQDRTGFSLAIPDGWQITRRDHYVYVREPNGARFLLIDQTTEPKADAVADWRRQEAARRNGIRDYRRIRIAPVNYYLEAADWEFTHTSANGTPLHVVSRGFVTSKNQAYGLYWSTPQSQWSASTRYFTTFAATFRPRR